MDQPEGTEYLNAGLVNGDSGDSVTGKKRRASPGKATIADAGTASACQITCPRGGSLQIHQRTRKKTGKVKAKKKKKKETSLDRCFFFFSVLTFAARLSLLTIPFIHCFSFFFPLSKNKCTTRADGQILFYRNAALNSSLLCGPINNRSDSFQARRGESIPSRECP